MRQDREWGLVVAGSYSQDIPQYMNDASFMVNPGMGPNADSDGCVRANTGTFREPLKISFDDPLKRTDHRIDAVGDSQQFRQSVEKFALLFTRARHASAQRLSIGWSSGATTTDGGTKTAPRLLQAIRRRF
jgi:hypothetical protein